MLWCCFAIGFSFVVDSVVLVRVRFEVFWFAVLLGDLVLCRLLRCMLCLGCALV